MTIVNRYFLASAALSLLLATLLGAYGTHALQVSFSDSAWSAYETAVQYQFYHSLGLIGTTLIAAKYPDSRLIALSGWLLIAGIVLFCGSIYATSFGAPAIVEVAAPIGGTAFMAGWLALTIGVIKTR